MIKTLEPAPVTARTSTMSEFLAHALRGNTNNLLMLIARFDYNHFNRLRPGSAWSAGAIAEHLLLFDLHVLNVLSGNAVSVDRDEQDMITPIQTAMEDDQKQETLENLRPSGVSKDPSAFADRFLESRRKLMNAIINKDMFLVYPASPHAEFGILSGIEWINFVVYHCKRHMDQMEALL